jgi:hypothetical protein
MKNANPPSRSCNFAVPGTRARIHFPPIPAALALAAVLALAQRAEAATYTWNGTGTGTNWSLGTDWTPAGGPPKAADSVVFGNTDTSSSSTTVNNTVDSGFNNSITGLTYNSVFASANSAVYDVTQIPTGQTLTVTGPVLVGGLNEGAGGYTTYAYMTGGGTFVATGSTFTVQNYGSASGANAAAYLNLSALNYFVYNNSAGRISIEDTPGSLTRLGGSMVLAAVSNYITVSNLNLGTSTSAQAGPSGTLASGVVATLTLGPGTNVFNVANFNLANNKSTFTVANTGGGLRIRGVSGADTDRPAITIGNRNQTGTGTCLGTLSLNGCPVSIKASTLTVGANPNTGSTTGDTGTGVVQFDTGTVDATTILMANSATALGAANGTISVGANGTLIVGFGGVSLATQTASGVATGALNVANGGTITCDGNITEAISTGLTGTGSLNVGGALIMGLETSIGTASQPINNFTLSNNATWQITPFGNGGTNAIVDTLNWPSPDSGLTINIAGLPAGAAVGSNYTLINFTAMNGSLVAPILNLPAGVIGSLSIQNLTNLVLSITGGPVPPPPPAPTLFTGTLESGNQVVLNWTDPGATSYAILQSTNLAGPYSFIAEGVTATTYTDTTVVPGVGFYYYEVIGVNANGPSSNSSPDTVPYGLGNQLINPGFELLPAKSGWTSTTNTSVVTTNAGAFYLNGTNGACSHDATAELVLSHSGTNVARLFGASNGVANTAFLSQIIPTYGGSTLTAGAFAYISHEDLMAGKNSFYLQANFLDGNGNLLACYQSFVVTNLQCGETSPFPVDTWVFLGLTNAMQVTGGINTGTVISNVPTGILTAPANSANVQFQALFVQENGLDGGSVYMDDADLVLLTGPVPPTLSTLLPNHVTLCTNTALTCTASSPLTVITNIQIIVTTSTLGSTTSTTVTNTFGTNTVGSPGGLTVTGIGTATANISYALVTNTIYSSVVVKATDKNNVTVTSPTDTLDTLTPALVIEASDFNYDSGQFINTPPNGGLALYQGLAGSAGIDFNGATRTATQSYYRPGDAVIIQAASTQGASTALTEQKFVTAAANGDTTDVELEVGYNSAGEWLNYTRTYGSAATNSAPAGTYNVWLFSATSGSGTQADLYQVTSDPTLANQTTILLGSFGNSNYVNTSYNNYEYLPLLDQYGNIATVTLSNTETLRCTVVGNPNLGFYMLTPPVCPTTPTLQYVYPNGSGLLEGTNEFTFVVNANCGAAIASNGISLLLNGVNVTSGLSFTQAGSAWTVSYPIYQNTLYTAIINVTNTAAVSITYSASFDTFNPNNYVWEAVDYDFTTNGVGGQFIDDPVPTGDNNVTPAAGQPSLGTLATNSYYAYPAGLVVSAVTQQGVDVGWINVTGQVMDYRTDTVATQPATDDLRAKFIAAQQEFSDVNIGPFNICYYTNGSWLNYTRHYPTNTFYIWGRVAGTPAFTNGVQMSILTSGYGTSIQTSNILGTFSDSHAAGFQAWHWIPLLDSDGNQVEVSLGQGVGGIETLQATSESPQYCNLEFFMLVPVPPQFTLTPSLGSGGQLNISFPTESGVQYAILYKSSLTAPNWTPVGISVAGDGNVHVVNVSATPGYYSATAH